MRSSFIKHSFVAAGVAIALLGFVLLATGASAQEAAPQAAPAEAESLERLAAQLAERRAALDARRQALAREAERLAAVDQPASEAEVALWRDRHETAERLEGDLETLRALVGVLTPEALAAVSLPETSAGRALAPDPGLVRTSLEVNLRAAPEKPPFAVLQAGMLVVRLATAADGWSLVATPHGIGFVPASQLQREP